MQTKMMDDCDVGVPWLEHDAGDGRPPERTPLVSTPFSIGRVESADLQVDSGRVSREHAVIVQEGDRYRIRDLGSTNGTQVNGESIDEAELVDGDVVTIADAEFTFATGQSAHRGNTATQVMSGAERQTTSHQLDALRRTQELLLQRGFEVALEPILPFADDSVFGYQAVDAPENYELKLARLNTIPRETVCRFTRRCGELYRTAAAEQHARLEHPGRLFVEVSASEIDEAGMLESHLIGLQSLLAHGDALVAVVPAEAAVDLPTVREFRARLAAAEISVGLGGFVGRKSQVMAYKDGPPEFLLLAPSMVKNVRRGGNQRRQLDSLLEACDDLGTRAIVTGVSSEDDEHECREIGFEFFRRKRDGRGRTTSSRKKVES